MSYPRKCREKMVWVGTEVREDKVERPHYSNKNIFRANKEIQRTVKR